MKINLILLAAGNSTRYGSNKLINTKQGKPMVSLILDTIIKAQKFYIENQDKKHSWNQIIVVTQYEEVVTIAKQFQQANLIIVRNSSPNIGISHSIKLGIQNGSCDVDGYCFAVCDQPFLTSETYKKLVNAYVKQQGIIVVKANNQKGNPVIFDKKYKQELLQLQGDIGGKQIINKYPHDITWINIENKQELVDIDIPEDWRR